MNDEKNKALQTHNPDVLSCLANLSNDEVFTPPDVVNAMLDLLPQELFANPETRFLDPMTKTGGFLREIAKRLLVGLKPIIPDLQKRIDHIYRKQLFGIAITELTSLVSRRTLYCSKYASLKYSVCHFEDPEGNIRYREIPHSWVNGRCAFCGASEVAYGAQARGRRETHAYEFIHRQDPNDIFNMKFDVIIGNPPYQLEDGGGNGKSAIPLYHRFVENAKILQPRYLSMIIPARWLGGGKGLDVFRENMLTDSHLRKLVDYTDSTDCFTGVDIAGGICYFLWDRDNIGLCEVSNTHSGKTTCTERKLNEFDTFVRYGESISIIHKVRNKSPHFMNEQVMPRRPFGLDSNTKLKKSGEVKVKSASGFGFVDKSSIKSGREIINKYNVIMSKVSSEHAGQPDKNGQMRVISIIDVLPPEVVCTETYLVVGSFEDLVQAENLTKYMKTRFFRFLLQQSLYSQNISKEKFQFIPVENWDEEWTDEKLYAKYGLNEEEIAFIESMIRPMEA
jgi:site-specific DNA-methyltransferase (adenine-specific)